MENNNLEDDMIFKGMTLNIPHEKLSKKDESKVDNKDFKEELEIQKQTNKD